MTIRWYSLDTDLRTVERGPVDLEGAYKIIDGYFARLRPQYQTGEEALAATMFGLRAWTGRTCRSASTPQTPSTWSTSSASSRTRSSVWSLVAVSATSDQTEERVLDEAELVLHVDGVWGVEADLH